MIIDEGILTALLVEKTGRSKQEVKNQLNELTERIQQTTTSGRQFHIKGFGTFGMDDGTIYFDAASQLKTEINQKYAGMKPIELMAAFKETGTGVPVEKPLPKKTPEKPEAPNKEQPREEKKKSANKKKKTAAVASATSKQPKQAKPKKKDPPSQKTGATNNKTTILKKIGVAAVVIIAVFAGGWLIYASGVLNTTEERSASGVSGDSVAQNAQQEPLVAVTDDSNTAENQQVDITEQNTDSVVSENEADEAGTNAVFGLKGQRTPEGNDGYTIVIHSFRSKSPVQGIADSLAQAGYRITLEDVSSRGQIWWRLGLGQFKTIADAQEAARQLSEPYRQNHFIKRIK